MQETRLFRIGRASALAAMLGVSIAPVLGQARDEPIKPETPDGAGSGRYERILASNKDFWIDAWGWEFVDGKSGMALIEESGPNTWTVGLFDADAQGVVAQGVFTEVFRLSLPQLSPSEEELQESGLVSLERYVVAGLIRGSTGYQTALTAVVHEIGIPELDDLVRVITPVQYIQGIGSAVVSSPRLCRICRVCVRLAVSVRWLLAVCRDRAALRGVHPRMLCRSAGVLRGMRWGLRQPWCIALSVVYIGVLRGRARNLPARL